MNQVCTRLLILAMTSVLPLAAGCSTTSNASSNKENESRSISSEKISTSVSVKKDSSKIDRTQEASKTPGQSEKEASVTHEDTDSSSSAKTKTVGTFEVTMNSAFTQSSSGPFIPDDGNTYLVTVFKILNNSDQTVEISSGMNFEASSDGQDIFQAWTVEPEGIDWIDGNIEPGQSIEGCVCFEAPEDFSQITVSFFPDSMSADSATFTIKH